MLLHRWENEGRILIGDKLEGKKLYVGTLAQGIIETPD
jgi:hypothetical protein